MNMINPSVSSHSSTPTHGHGGGLVQLPWVSTTPIGAGSTTLLGGAAYNTSLRKPASGLSRQQRRERLRQRIVHEQERCEDFFNSRSHQARLTLVISTLADHLEGFRSRLGAREMLYDPVEGILVPLTNEKRDQLYLQMQAKLLQEPFERALSWALGETFDAVAMRAALTRQAEFLLAEKTESTSNLHNAREALGSLVSSGLPRLLEQPPRDQGTTKDANGATNSANFSSVKSRLGLEARLENLSRGGSSSSASSASSVTGGAQLPGDVVSSSREVKTKSGDLALTKFFKNDALAKSTASTSVADYLFPWTTVAAAANILPWIGGGTSALHPGAQQHLASGGQRKRIRINVPKLISILVPPPADVRPAHARTIISDSTVLLSDTTNNAPTTTVTSAANYVVTRTQLRSLLFGEEVSDEDKTPVKTPGGVAYTRPVVLRNLAEAAATDVIEYGVDLLALVYLKRAGFLFSAKQNVLLQEQLIGALVERAWERQRL